MSQLVKFFEIPATDVKRAINFYSKVLQLKIELFDFEVEKMGMFPDNVGAISQAEGFKPCEQGVLITFDGGNDVNDALQRVKDYGGKVIIEKTKIQAENQGYFAVFMDTEGNRIGLYSDN